LWNPGKLVDPKRIPSPGDLLAEASGNRVGGGEYDRQWPSRTRKALWQAMIRHRAFRDNLSIQPRPRFIGRKASVFGYFSYARNKFLI
jgi:hypothetical protein